MKNQRAFIAIASIAMFMAVGVGCTPDDSGSGDATSPDPTTQEPETETPNDADPNGEDPSSENSDDEDPSAENPTTENSGTQSPGTEHPSDDAQIPDSTDFDLPPIASQGFPDSEPGAEPMWLIDVRFGKHDGFDRVVFEHTGEGVLGFSAEYVDEAFADGSGLPVEVDADVILEVWVTGVATPMDPETGDLLEVVDTEQEADIDSNIETVVPMLPFEGTVQYLIGLDREVPIHITMLQDPARLVIDFATP